jgi:hypothetical protein
MSRFTVYLVAGCALGEMESNVRFRELVMVSDATETTLNNQYEPREMVKHEALHTSCLVPKIQRIALLSWPRADLAHCRVRSLERRPLQALLQSPGRENSWIAVGRAGCW